jgi:DNA repair protein RadC
MQTEDLIVQELEINYTPSHTILCREKIKDSKTAYDMLKRLYNPKTIACQEEFIVLYLNNANVPLASFRLSKGGLSSSVADIRLIFSVALKCLATGIILSHNHPSGRMVPSTQDKQLTRRIREVGKIMDIVVLDHIILSPFLGQYYSFEDEGL